MDSFEISSDNYNPRSLENSAADPERRQSARPQPIKTNASQPRTAPEKTAKTEKAEAKAPAAKSSPSKGKWRMFFGILLIVSAVYLLIVSISYFSHGAEDQSIVQGASYTHIAGSANEIGNTGGPVGAVMSDLLMSRWLGIGSFIIIFYIGAVGVSLVKLHKFRLWNLTYKCLLCAIVLSILAGFVTYSLTSYNYWGGDHGRLINETLMTHTGIFGAIAVNILLVSAVVLVFLKEIQSVYSLYRERMDRYHEKMERERAEAEARRRKAAEMLKNTDEPVSPPDAGEMIPEDETIKEEAPIKEEVATETVPAREERAIYVPEAAVTHEEPAEVYEKKAAEEPEEEVSSENVMEDIPEMGEATVMDEIPEETSDVTLTVNAPAEVKEAKHIQTDVYDPTAELSRFRFPSIDLLEKREQRTDHVDIAEQEENKDKLTKTLSTYGVKISHIEATVGPTITRYEVIPAEGERIRSIKNLGDDLALSLSALGIRIIAPIPGKGTIGIEVPNKDPQIVSMRSILASEKFQNSDYELPIAMGRTITNDIYIADLAKLPHLLVAGATGMGKSVGLNAIIASLLYKKHPAELKFVLVDPKRVELSLYRKLERHYLAALPGEDPIITDTSKVVAVLNSLCIEMGNRLSLLEDAGVRNIKEYNAKFIARRLNPEKHRFMPYIVLIIDEFADIILTAGREVESPVSRLAAVARAAGIHLILATQRPAVNVITGGIKTNIPGRIAFRTIQSIDSRTILDRTGAEQLVGKGDMIFSRDGVLERVQCAFIDTEEVKSICESISEQIGYDRPYDLPEFVAAPAEGGASAGGPLTDRDPLFEECARAVVDANLGSASYLQRKFNIGYPRAGKIIDQLEAAGIVGPPQGGKPRQVLMDMTALENYLTNSGSNK